VARLRVTWLPVALLAGVLLAGCAPPAAAPPKAKVPEVQVSRALVRAVTDHEDFTAWAAPFKTVEVRARVTGYLDKAYLDKNYIREGCDVKKGELLFVIDARPYKAALDAANAQVALSAANLKLANVTLNRARTAAGRGTGIVSALELDQNRAQQEQAIASLNLAKANLQTAQLNFDFCQVSAPISGRVSRRFIDPNNVVKADDTLLTTIVALDPIYVYFDQDERTAQRIKRLIQQGKMKSPRDAPVPIEMGLEDEKDEKTNLPTFPHKGTLDFEDNQLDLGTGTLRVRGLFPNADRLISPGQYVRVRVPLGRPYTATLVAEQAISTDQGQKVVYVLDKENKVVYRRVKIGRLEGPLRVILPVKRVKRKDGTEEVEGVGPTEQVIVSGLQRIRQGNEVKPKPVEMEDVATGSTSSDAEQPLRRPDRKKDANGKGKR
jgi:RND family efflux transporter MFP subunit